MRNNTAVVPATRPAAQVPAMPAPVEQFAMQADELKAQVTLIQNVMNAVMKPGEHYGTIPGCGDKPALLKPGAEKLAMTFRLAPSYEIERIDLPNGHREYQVTATLTSVMTGSYLGQGVGACSTREGKYRYRSEDTGRAVPKEYWDTRDRQLLGGPQFTPRKSKGEWCIVERVEHDNPADYYNTCLKMAKKRALVDAVLTATAASDIFTQDVEDDPSLYGGKPAQTAQPGQRQAAPTQGAAPRRNGGGRASAKQLTAIGRMIDGRLGWDERTTLAAVNGFLGAEVDTLADLTMAQASAIIDALGNGTLAAPDSMSRMDDAPF
ncbi:hypothetical protein [Desulfobaculum xiamenense]|nr:hypothetical protein [Desulfobaculum xiamenense]